MKAQIEHKGKTGIYCIKNTVNNKVYIGKAKCIHRRIKKHITALNTCDTHSENDHLIKAWHKYGRENFEYSVLEYCELDNEVLRRLELHWQVTLECTNQDKGYNFRLDSDTSMITSDKTKKKLSLALEKRYSDPEQRLKTGKASSKFWSENPEIKEQMRKNVKKARQEKYQFLQYTKDMTLVKVWSTVEDIILENPNYKWQNIYAASNGNKPTIYGYVWKKELKI